ncbi:hypothetical protein [Sphingobacterium suaedae]|uniref:Uncharacterized protein n=1 Tax=Sphingobacterium suaedae TaxID=1686402 RepID=A0ABW5KCU1_9SPHI
MKNKETKRKEQGIAENEQANYSDTSSTKPDDAEALERQRAQEDKGSDGGDLAGNAAGNVDPQKSKD